MRPLLLLVCLALPASGLAQTRTRTARVELDVSVWERGVSMVHTSEQRLELSLVIRGGTASLTVTGDVTGRSATLSPSGPSDRSEHTSRIEERFDGSVTRDGEVLTLALTRVGSTAYAPHDFTWRCTPATDVTAHRHALRCVSTAPLDPMPWHNGHFSQVPIVLADDWPTNHVTWDGETAPFISVP